MLWNLGISIMAFEDDMIEAGYSDEQEYLDSLLDDFEDNYKCQEESMSYYNDEYDFYDEEEEQELQEKNRKREAERLWLVEWKKNNPDLAIIWQEYFRSISYLAEVSNLDNRRFMGLKEYIELKKWVKERERFESERKSREWEKKINELFSIYKEELFKYYCPDDKELINWAIVSQQAHELSTIIQCEPILWEHVCSHYQVEQIPIERIEEEAFWSLVYNRDMDYEFWKDTNIDKYNDFAKQWVAKNALYVYGEWLDKHKAEETEWKNKNHNLWEKFKLCCEVRERNNFIESKIEEYNKGKRRPKNYFLYSLLDSDYDDYCDDDTSSEPFLYDFERLEVDSFDLSSLDVELRQFIQDRLSTLDTCKIDRDSSRKADELMTQLWAYTNRNEWELTALKKHNDYLFKYEQKYCSKLLKWWKDKYPKKWDDLAITIFPSFKKDLEIVMKFRLWALDDNREAFISLADKYLAYWNKTLRLMFGQDIHEQLCKYFVSEIGHTTDFWGEDVDYIKKHTSEKNEIEIWLKELRDKVIWKYFYDVNYSDDFSLDHLFLENMYSSLYQKKG